MAAHSNPPPSARTQSPTAAAGRATGGAGRNDAVSIPNLLTYGRIGAVPLLVALLSWPQQPVARWLALLVFVAAAVTDYFDGHLARRWGQQSALGRMLDPIADKLLLTAVLIMLVADGTISGPSVWASVAVLCREILVSGLREFLADLRILVPVTPLAKWKTAAQLAALGFLVAGPAGATLLPWTVEIGLVLLWISAILTLYTGYDYVRAGAHHLMREHGSGEQAEP